MYKLFSLEHMLVDLKIVSTVFNILARAAISGSFVGLQLLAAELYPTSLRHRVYGYAQGCVDIFAVAEPYIGGGLVIIYIL